MGRAPIDTIICRSTLSWLQLPEQSPSFPLKCKTYLQTASVAPGVAPWPNNRVVSRWPSGWIALRRAHTHLSFIGGMDCMALRAHTDTFHFQVEWIAWRCAHTHLSFPGGMDCMALRAHTQTPFLRCQCHPRLPLWNLVSRRIPGGPDTPTSPPRQSLQPAQPVQLIVATITAPVSRPPLQPNRERRLSARRHRGPDDRTR